MTASTQVKAKELLRAEGIDAGYGRATRAPRILHGVDLTVREGQTVGIVGESGSGKSTLARVLVGQMAPLSGSVQLLGDPLTTARDGTMRARRRQIQLVP